MREFLRFWQRLPRFALGLATLLVLAAGFTDRSPVSHAITVLGTFRDETLAKFVSGIVAAFLLLAAGALGVFLLDLQVSAFGIVFRLAVRPRFLRRLLERLRLIELATPVEHLSLDLYRREQERILEFYRLRSEATTGHDRDATALTQLYDGVRTHMSELHDPELFLGLAYWHTLTQDQAKLEEWEFSIKDLYYLLIFLAILLFVGIRRGFAAGLLVFLSILLLVSTLVSLPLIRDRKRRLSVLLLATYCDNFTLGEGATIEDRADV